MATLIPALGACLPRMTHGEKRLAERLEQKLDADYLLWHNVPTLRDEAFAIADHLASAHEEGHAWGDMAVLCADRKTMDLCASALAQRKVPQRVRKKSGEYRPGADAIQVMTMKVGKGLEWPVVAVINDGKGSRELEEDRRLIYVSATQSNRLIFNFIK